MHKWLFITISILLPTLSLANERTYDCSSEELFSLSLKEGGIGNGYTGVRHKSISFEVDISSDNVRLNLQPAFYNIEFIPDKITLGENITRFSYASGGIIIDFYKSDLVLAHVGIGQHILLYATCFRK